jgi:hypothetical protein
LAVDANSVRDTLNAEQLSFSRDKRVQRQRAVDLLDEAVMMPN